jgi:hypothetical protein
VAVVAVVLVAIDSYSNQWYLATLIEKPCIHDQREDLELHIQSSFRKVAPHPSWQGKQTSLHSQQSGSS